jgi:hypothetical protein
MTLQKKIDVLPPWADEISLGGLEEDRNYIDLMAAMARLALAKEVIADRVQIRSHDDWLAICALIKALEPPK